MSQKRVDLLLGTPCRADLALLAALRELAPALSRAALKEWFREGRVSLATGARVVASTELPAGRHTLVVSPWDDSALAPPRAAPSPEGCFLDRVYEDEDLLVLHKPTGLPSVPQVPDEHRTAVGAALAHLPSLAQVGRGGYEPGILHRLDTGTSGLLVFAKHDAEYARLRALWKDGHVGKHYRALVRRSRDDAAPLTPGSRLDWPLAHDAKSDRRMIAVVDATRPAALRGKPLPALTHVLSTREVRDGFLEVEVRIETGVMHQIRCHLATAGWPIQGDPIYRGVPSRRLWLHAWRLEIPTASGTRLLLEAAFPEGWPR